MFNKIFNFVTECDIEITAILMKYLAIKGITSLIMDQSCSYTLHYKISPVVIPAITRSVL
jgi:hypothetical protein